MKSILFFIEFKICRILLFMSFLTWQSELCIANSQQFTLNEILTDTIDSANQSKRQLNYWPVDNKIVTINGQNRFTRAIYGANSGFRLETSDYPEFAFYMPQMGGNLSFDKLIFNDNRENLHEIEFDILQESKGMLCMYHPGTREYRFSVPSKLRSNPNKPAFVEIIVMALYDIDGAIWKVSSHNVKKGAKASFIYGGASNKRFSREGDLGVDKKDCFDFTIENCRNNFYHIDSLRFSLRYGKGSKKGEQIIQGLFDSGCSIELKTEQLLDKSTGNYIKGYIPLCHQGKYFVIGNGDDIRKTLLKEDKVLLHSHIKSIFNKCQYQVRQIARTIQIDTPDPFINTMGWNMSMASDAIWGEDSVWLHGAIGWRVPLPGWRAAYTGDVIGWHKRARSHFNNYAASQLIDVPVSFPNDRFDTLKNLARSLEKIGTPMYSTGYIARYPNNTKKVNHYDMNLVYIDELLWHFNWTGDWDYVYQMWPTLERHLQWEKRNFDPNDDGLYDAYCCIWASDALSYNGGAVTHSSAYNYRANKMAAMIAQHFATDDKCIKSGEANKFAIAAVHYKSEAEKIIKAINNRLWIKGKGIWAEFQDEIGLKRTHESPALWTIYHALDSEIASQEQGDSAMRYVSSQIPYIPIRVFNANKDSRFIYFSDIYKKAYDHAMEDLQSNSYAVISTTNWQPYLWSINNVALAEMSHAALAYWQAGQNDLGFILLKSALLDAMYLGSSPGNFVQISHYDAARGECYRDFGDPIGITSRAIIQGLFGVRPDRLNSKVKIVPGFPNDWEHASIKTPDYSYDYQYDADKRMTKVSYMPSTHFFSDTVIIELSAKTESLENCQVRIGRETMKMFKCEKQFSTNKNGKKLSKIIVHINNNKVYKGNPKPIEVILQWKGNKITTNELNKQSHDIEEPAMGYFENVDSTKLRLVDLSDFFNDEIKEMFHHEYLAPRYPFTTLSVPKQGYGEWCTPLDSFSIDDSYIRKSAQLYGKIKTGVGVPFKSSAKGPNVAFTSIWNNFPNRLEIPLDGKASHIYLMMVGSTHPMQSHIANGVLHINYQTGECDSLLLTNPETWWPIDKDYVTNKYAFYSKQPVPYRQLLGRPITYRPHNTDVNRKITGGAAMLLDIPINANKELKSLVLEVLSNEILIGIMGITLQE